MAEKKNESFTVTDRRLFTAEGELRKETSEEQEVAVAPKPVTAAESTASTQVAEIASDSQMPAGPSVGRTEGAGGCVSGVVGGDGSPRRSERAVGERSGDYV